MKSLPSFLLPLLAVLFLGLSTQAQEISLEEIQ